ncbi:MAG: hypothetical protein V1816_15675 [Pseudomonadota bacterium]
MRQILFDELTREDLAKLEGRLREFATPSLVEGLYWIEAPRDLLDPGQYEAEADQPFCFAVELGDGWVKFELLIRSLANMRSCQVRYAGAAQQKFILDLATRLVEELGLMT